MISVPVEKEGAEMADPKRLSPDGFDMMWSFLMMGGQEANIPALKEHCEIL